MVKSLLRDILMDNVMNKANGKHGQVEMFGLAFIVVLISIGFFLFVSLKSQQTEDNPQKEYTNDKLVNDFVLAILDVNANASNCMNFTIKDLIVDCARDHRLKCGTGPLDDSCKKVNESINFMLNRTFMTRNSRFRFYSENLQVSGKELINITYLNCTSRSEGRRGVAIISLYPAPGNVYLNMNLCYQ
jgi:hypothetical protein